MQLHGFVSTRPLLHSPNLSFLFQTPEKCAPERKTRVTHEKQIHEKKSCGAGHVLEKRSSSCTGTCTHVGADSHAVREFLPAAADDALATNSA